MKKLTEEEIQWFKDNIEEIVSELEFKCGLVKNFYLELEEYREKNDRIGYSLKFKELLKKEEEKYYGRENQ